MQKLKNRKRLTVLLATFTIIFVTGVAFAADFGILDITGMIGIGAPELSVIWTNQETDNVSEATTNTATILNDDKGIEWAIGFAEAGTVTLIATATNNGLVPAHIDSVDVSTFWFDFVAETGLSYTLDKTNFTGPLLPGDDAILVMTVTWDGAFEPFGGISPLNALDLLLDYEEILGGFVIDIVYRRYEPTP